MIQSESELLESLAEMYSSMYEGKIPWDSTPLRSGWTPREKNRAKRISTGVENANSNPSDKHFERYGKLSAAHSSLKDVKDKKEILHKNLADTQPKRNPINGALGGNYQVGPGDFEKDKNSGIQRIPRNHSKGEDLAKRSYGAKGDKDRVKYYEKGPRGLKEPK